MNDGPDNVKHRMGKVDTSYYLIGVGASTAGRKANRAVAIVLSGTGLDGSRGLHAVKDVDGIVMAQAVETAKFDGMPRAAAATEIVDLILPPEALHRLVTRPLGARGRQPYAHRRAMPLLRINA